MPSLTKRLVDTLQPKSKDYFEWDDTLPCFGLRVWPTGRKVFVAQYRVGKLTKRLKLGNYGALTVDEARKLAKAALGDVAKGEDPQLERKTRRSSITISQLCDDYFKDAERGLILGKQGRPKKPKTLATDRGRINRHIKPLLGKKLVKDVSAADVSKFIRDITLKQTAVTEKTSRLRGKSIVRGGSGTAARTAGLLGGILSYAVMAGIIAHNPAAGVKRPPGRKLNRRLSPAEYAVFGRALAEADQQGERPQAVKGILTLALTGCRLGEVESLKWAEVDLKAQAFDLRDTKEGRSIRPIGLPVVELIRSIPPLPDNEFVFTSVRAVGSKYGGLPGAWDRLVARSGLKGVTMHTLRHSFVSVAADLEYTESTIAALVGHAGRTVTSGYVHHLDAVLVAAADRVAVAISRMMNGMSFDDARVID